MAMRTRAAGDPAVSAARGGRRRLFVFLKKRKRHASLQGRAERRTNEKIRKVGEERLRDVIQWRREMHGGTTTFKGSERTAILLLPLAKKKGWWILLTRTTCRTGYHVYQLQLWPSECGC